MTECLGISNQWSMREDIQSRDANRNVAQHQPDSDVKGLRTVCKPVETLIEIVHSP